MKINILENKKYKMEIELENETHTFCNLLKENLWKINDVKIAGYNIKHPLIGKPKIIVETSSKEAKAALIEAAKNAKKQLENFEKQISKEL